MDKLKVIRARVGAWKVREDKRTTVDSMAHALNDREDLLGALEEAVVLLKEVTFQFEPLLQDLAEEHYLDDEVQDALVKQLAGIEAFLAKIKGD